MAKFDVVDLKNKKVSEIELSDDGNSFTSSIEYTLFDQDGSELEGGGSAEGHGTRMVFPPMARQ